MNIAGPFLVVFILFGARIIGERFGWYYHAAILVVLGAGLGALFRLAIPKMLEPAPALPPTEDPEGIRIREFLDTARKDLDQKIPALCRDSMVIPILACAPAAIILCILHQRSYLPDYSLWFRLSFIPVLLYVFVRYIFPKTYKKGA